MKIKGYIPADKKVATEVGVSFEYSIPLDDGYAKFTIRAKHTGSANVEFMAGAAKYNERTADRAKTKQKFAPEEGLAELAELYWDTVVISWETTAIDEDVSKTKPIVPSKENFIACMSNDLFVTVFVALQADCAKAANFRATDEAEVVKN